MKIVAEMQNPPPLALSPLLTSPASDPTRLSRCSPSSMFPQRIVVCQGRTNKKQSDNTIPAATNGNNPSRICPPNGWRGRLERGSCMLLPRRTIDADGRYERNVLRLSDASDYFYDDLCPLPGAVTSLQILPTSPPQKCPGGNDKDDDR